MASPNKEKPLGVLKSEDVDIYGFNLCQIDIINVCVLYMCNTHNSSFLSACGLSSQLEASQQLCTWCAWLPQIPAGILQAASQSDSSISVYQV